MRLDNIVSNKVKVKSIYGDFMGIHYDYKSKRGERAMLKEAKRKARLAQRRAKRLTITGTEEKPELKTQEIKIDFKDSKYATGRRKRSIAKVWVKKGSGNIFVNGIKMINYFKRPVHQIIVTRPLEVSKALKNIRT